MHEAIKSMAALFTAVDRTNYQRLIPQHIVDMLTIPREILSHLSHGGFTVSIRGRHGHSVGIDEAHEMCINKECITKPSGDYINRCFYLYEQRPSSTLKTNLFQNTGGQVLYLIHQSMPTTEKAKTLK